MWFSVGGTVWILVAWFKRYKTLKSVPVGLVGRSGRVAQAEKIIIFSENSLGLRPRL